MRKFILFIFLMTGVLSVSAQQDDTIYDVSFDNSITFGVLNGGGGIVGMDLEFRLNKTFGLQLGAGLFSAGGGINLHLKPGVDGDFVCLSYWHQGFGENHTNSVVGPSYVFRAKKLFTAQLGFGATLGEGPAWPEDTDYPPVMLTYSIGLYIPW